jgi:hypothetical protein
MQVVFFFPIPSHFVHGAIVLDFDIFFFLLQNDLEEFFSMVNFTNPGVLGDAAYFRRHYEVCTFFMNNKSCC